MEIWDNRLKSHNIKFTILQARQVPKWLKQVLQSLEMALPEDQFEWIVNNLEREQITLKWIMQQLLRDLHFHIKTDKIYHHNTVFLNLFYQLNNNKVIYMVTVLSQLVNPINNKLQSLQVNFKVEEREQNSGEMTIKL